MLQGAANWLAAEGEWAMASVGKGSERPHGPDPAGSCAPWMDASCQREVGAAEGLSSGRTPSDLGYKGLPVAEKGLQAGPAESRGIQKPLSRVMVCTRLPRPTYSGTRGS